MMLTQGLFVLSLCILLAVKFNSAYPRDVATAFNSSKLVPDVTPCAPNYELQVEYPHGNFVYLGKKLSLFDTIKAPTIKFIADPSAYYTLVMVDPDAPVPSNATLSQIRHWIVGNIPGDKVYAGETLFGYISPIPTPGFGPHRYALLVYKQKGPINFKEPKRGSTITPARFLPISEFVKKYSLGCPVFGNYFLSAARYLLGVRQTYY